LAIFIRLRLNTLQVDAGMNIMAARRSTIKRRRLRLQRIPRSFIWGRELRPNWMEIHSISANYLDDRLTLRGLVLK
jgi:hypothetical protein